MTAAALAGAAIGAIGGALPASAHQINSSATGGAYHFFGYTSCERVAASYHIWNPGLGVYGGSSGVEYLSNNGNGNPYDCSYITPVGGAGYTRFGGHSLTGNGATCWVDAWNYGGANTEFMDKDYYKHQDCGGSSYKWYTVGEYNAGGAWRQATTLTGTHSTW